ncbi:hypothetical protein HYU07_04520 [Candidatus Woesearchaeota archaeon]|nr:hypothetical protein [Candidatus Woesearchaeota archaeon]
MDIVKNIFGVFIEATPVLLMIVLTPFVKNDYILAAIYLVIIAISFLVRYEKGDAVFLVLGFAMMFFFEYLFISTGSETFERRSLFGVMPVWLPILWAYGFVAIKRAADILK